MKVLKEKLTGQLLLVLVFLFVWYQGEAQDFTTYTPPTGVELENKEAEFLIYKDQYQAKQAEILAKVEELEIPKTINSEDGTAFLYRIYGSHPVYISAHNETASLVVKVDDARDDYGLTGSGETLYLFEPGTGTSDGMVRTTHEAFDDGNGGSRVTQVDDFTGSQSDGHATHVAGTMVGYCPSASATGMAPEAELRSFEILDATNTGIAEDLLEMKQAAAHPTIDFLVSNHSYGIPCGWRGTSWEGDANVSTIEDFKFGWYSDISSEIDEITYDNPYYVCVFSAGNERDDAGSGLAEKDGGDDGFDCLPPNQTAKNTIVVGAVDGDDNNSIADFSSFGPTDDGRVKPDLVAHGVDVYSSVATKNYRYNSKTGTSQAAPSISGGIGLLLEHQRNIYGSIKYRSSTVKGLLIHTSEDLGNTGPDYKYGWGLADFQRAADLMEADGDRCLNIQEFDLVNQSEVYFDLVAKAGTSGQDPFKVTICWTDPEHAPIGPIGRDGIPSDLNNSTKMLVNDLDLRVFKYNGTEFKPWVLNASNPGNAATNGDNDVDNIEQVIIPASDGGLFRVVISHKGTLVDQDGNTASQVVSVIADGMKGGDVPSLNVLATGVHSSGTYVENATAYVHTSGTNTIESNAKGYYFAGDEIKLTPGFTSKTGSEFLAKIFAYSTCTTGSFDLDDQETNGYQVNGQVESQLEETSKEELNESSENSIELYPNPAAKSITIDAEMEIRSIRILTLNGKVVQSLSGLSSKSVQVDLSDIEGGTYLMETTTESGIQTQSFQKL